MKKKIDPNNRRLDELLSSLQIEEEKKEQIIKFVEELTFQRLIEASKKSVRR